MNRKPSSPHFIVMSLNCGKHFNDLTNSVLAFVREYFDNPTFNNTSIFYCKSMCTEESYQWIGVDVELYLPEDWFTAEKAELREKRGIPAELEFKTKIELGWEMIQRAHANGLPFEAICCDDFYGKSGDFRAEMRAAGFVYMADVPHNTRVYLKRPAWLKCQRYFVVSLGYLRIPAIHPPFSRYNEWIFTS